jgi:hypothetical protein
VKRVTTGKPVLTEQWETEPETSSDGNDSGDEMDPISDSSSSSCEESDQEREDKAAKGNGHTGARHSSIYLSWVPPSIPEAIAAMKDLTEMLHPKRTSGHGHKNPNLGHILSHCLELMRSFLTIYTNTECGKSWMAASLEVVSVFDVRHPSRKRGGYATCRLHRWTKAYIQDRETLPIDDYGKGNSSRIEDEDLKQEVLLHLQEIGKYVRAADLSDYVNREDVKARYKLKGISLATAKRWMQRLGYRWCKTPTGQYVDGHEREDVVAYRQCVFIPKWMELQNRMWTWEEKNLTV